MAVKNFSKKLKSTEILNALDEAFSETEEPEETSFREKSKTYFQFGQQCC